jgi:hypothetical protein
MLAVVGIYQNGYVKLDKEYTSNNPVKVIVTFLEEIQNQSEASLTLSDFSFSKSQQILAKYQGSLSDAVIEARRSNFP